MTENNPIQTLMNEHDIISSAEGIISELENKWQENAEKYKDSVSKLLVFFRQYSDRFHHCKEEEILFRELRNNTDFMLGDILDELEEHHEMFRNTVKKIEDALDTDNFDKVQSLLSGYINDLLDHIAVENDELFIITESLLNEAELERMFFQFQDLDMELGADKKQQLADSLKQLTI